MNEQVICGLWSASESLANRTPLNKQESEAVSYLLKQLLGDLIPTVREYKNCQEAVKNMKKCTTLEQKQHFEPTIVKYEQKYSLIKK
ncbi:hypothetical protein [Candidatus Enterococcus mansonii]|uniref:Uncharacterized protein n=1 Tax=Candidatus Enterococcus mansonii TaxID=1834181 RepID=A0A242BYU4_9ENTE|nr:hypothetical protein [Enterococcus sp. 4G2_DIV0659]OTO03038.1 hypothetical protein A5880_003149 [Enterococcus sp. 4G2_DIV0659]